MFTFKSYFKKRGIMGFYLPLVAATLSLIIGLSYFGYSYSRYYQPWIGFVFLGAALSFFILSFFSLTERLAAIPLCVGIAIGFFFFLRYSYLYFSEVFYGAFRFEAIFSMEPIFLLTLLGGLIALVLGHFGIYAKTRKEEVKA